MKNKKKFSALLSFGLLISASAFARPMVLSNTNCKIYEYDRSSNHWNASSDKSSINKTLEISIFKKTFYTWKYLSKTYSADATCFSAPNAKMPTPPATTNNRVAPLPAATLSNNRSTNRNPVPVIKAPRAPRMKFLKGFHLGFISWGETPSLQSSTATYDLVYRSYAFFLGFSSQFYRTPSTSLEAEIDLIHGSAEVNEKSGNTASPISYNSKTSSVTGVQISPAIYYNSSADSSENGIGLMMPIIYRSTSYDDPGTGYTISGKSKLDIGLAVVGRLDKDSFLIEPRYGFTASLTNWYLAFALGKSF